jgi:hypothetical protein
MGRSGIFLPHCHGIQSTCALAGMRIVAVVPLP